MTKAKSDSSEAKLLGFGKMCYEQGKKDFADKLNKEVDEWVGIAGGWYKGWIREFIKKELSK